MIFFRKFHLPKLFGSSKTIMKYIVSAIQPLSRYFSVLSHVFQLKRQLSTYLVAGRKSTSLVHNNHILNRSMKFIAPNAHMKCSFSLLHVLNRSMFMSKLNDLFTSSFLLYIFLFGDHISSHQYKADYILQGSH